MTREEFFKTIQIATEISNIESEDDCLKNNENWDSLASVTVLSLFKKHFNLKISATDLKECNTFKDILDLANCSYN